MADEYATLNSENNSVDPSATIDIAKADDSKKIFVGGLQWETTEADLKEHFSQFGNVVAANIKIDRITGKSRGFGFVLFNDSSEVETAMHAPEHNIKGKKVDPKPAKAPMESKKKVFVGGMDPDATEEQIREYFQQFGRIDNLDLPFDKATSKRRAYIFVTFSNEDEAKEAAKTTKQEILGRTCDVRIAIPQEQVNRQKTWNQYGGYDQSAYPGYEGYGPGYAYQGTGYDAYGYPQQQGYYDASGYDYYGGYSGYNGYPGYGEQAAYPPQRGGGKIRGGRGGAPANGSYHPYSK